MPSRKAQRSSRGVVLLAIVVGGLASGCMNQQLRIATNRTVKTLPDLQYQQVVDNLATIASNPGFLPYLAVAGQGSIQVTDNRNSSLSLNLGSTPLGPDALGLGGSRRRDRDLELGDDHQPRENPGDANALPASRPRFDARGAHLEVAQDRLQKRCSERVLLRRSSRPGPRLGVAGRDRGPFRADPQNPRCRDPRGRTRRVGPCHGVLKRQRDTAAELPGSLGRAAFHPGREVRASWHIRRRRARRGAQQILVLDWHGAY